MQEFDPAAALLWYVALLFSLTLHEAAHAWAARRGGDPTAYLAGQVTLDPLPHIRREPFGMVIMPLLTMAMSGWMIGWASTPFDPRWADAYPRRAAWMSLAGPAANFAIVLAAAVAIRLGLGSGLFEVGSGAFDELIIAADGASALFDTLGAFLGVLFSLNLLLFVFNLLPLPPLDGSGAIGLLVSEPTARQIRGFLFQSPLAIFGILIAWVAIRQIFPPVYFFAIALLLP